MLSEKFNPAEIKAAINTAINAVKAEINAVKDEIKAEINNEIKPEINNSVKRTTHVGQIILSTTLNTADKVKNFYGGTWQAFGAGRVLVGAGSNGGYSFSAGSTGGEYAHTLTTNEMPSHSHSGTGLGGQAGGGATFNYPGGMGYYWDGGTYPAGGGQAHNNMQPYVVVYMWRRVA